MVGLFDGQVASLQNNEYVCGLFLMIDCHSFFIASYLYVLAENFSTIEVMSLNGPGKAQQIQSLDVAGTLVSAGIPISQCLPASFV